MGGTRVTTASLLALAAAEAGFAALLHAGAAGGGVGRAALLAALGLFALAAYPYFAAHQLRLVRGFPQATGRLLAWNNTAMYAGIFAGSAAGGRLLATFGFPVLCLSAAGAGVLGAVATRWAVARPLRRLRHARDRDVPDLEVRDVLRGVGPGRGGDRDVG
jgi:MFS transporter, DHA1 family, purine base/nucleoside efflux pump